MLIHLACNIYGIDVSRSAADINDLPPRIGGQRRPMMDDEITLARLASAYKPIQAKGASRTGRDTRILRAAMFAMVESGAGTGELAELMARSITTEQEVMRVNLCGTKNAAARTVQLTDWASRACSELLEQLNPDPNRSPGLFHNGLHLPTSNPARDSTSGVLGEIFKVAGLMQIGVKAFQAPMWWARSVFDSSGKIADAASVHGYKVEKASSVLGIDPKNVGAMNVAA